MRIKAPDAALALSGLVDGTKFNTAVDIANLAMENHDGKVMRQLRHAPPRHLFSHLQTAQHRTYHISLMTFPNSPTEPTGHYCLRRPYITHDTYSSDLVQHMNSSRHPVFCRPTTTSGQAITKKPPMPDYRQ
ncbi:hypothetical protein AVEN_194361-1 [Araneus ventricosus]|uniref:Uncharacterized protein n=1 Tax=Araneus ventricosus TaxID=182803 RepID=A0A4Y2T808_ARAVE|nr:hypothetical protein AVEN_194361-1 [Araneus ventricosus]